MSQLPQESYENTDQYRHQSHGHQYRDQPHQTIYPPLSEPGQVADVRRQDTRCKSSMSYIRDDQDNGVSNNSGAESFKTLLGGQGKDAGPSGHLLKKLEDAISRGDHK